MMRTTRRAARRLPPSARALPLLALLALLAGCFSLGRETTPLEQYVLGGVPGGAEASGSPPPSGPVLGVRRLDLAAYLATPEVLVREGPHRIGGTEFHRWGEELGEGVNRALAGYLRSRGGYRRIDVAPWSGATSRDYLLEVRLLRFEGVLPRREAIEGEAHVYATWKILRGGDGTVMARGTTDYREGGWRVGDYAALVLRLDRGVLRLATDLADAIAALPPGP